MKRFPSEEAFLAWTAGFFDGEGWVGVSASGRIGLQRKKPYHVLHVRVVQTSTECLELLKARFGGSIYTGKQRNHTAIVYSWRIANWRAMEFLKAVYPYTVVKRSQVEVALTYPIMPYRMPKLTQEITEQRMYVMNHLRALRAEAKTYA